MGLDKDPLQLHAQASADVALSKSMTNLSSLSDSSSTAPESSVLREVYGAGKNVLQYVMLTMHIDITVK